MRCLPVVVAALFALPGCIDPSLGTATSASTDPPVITLLHVNDTHSHLASWGPKDWRLDGTLGGLERAATVVAREKAADPNALFVHAGDLFHGDLFFNEYLGVPELLLLQSIGLDVFTPGNHEFQFGPDFLTGALDAAWPAGGGAVTMVDSNLDLGGYPVLGAWIHPTAIKTVDGVKVGFFGLTTPFDPLERPDPVVIDTDLAGRAQAAVDELRGEGAQVVVGIAHLGMPESRELATAVTGIDVIVNGHDHVALAEPESVGTTLIVSAGEYYRWVGRLRIAVESDHVELVDYALLDVDRRVPPLPAIHQTVAGLEAGITSRYGDVYHRVIGWAIEPLLDEPAAHRHQDKRDTAIGDLFTDGYRAVTHTDIAIEANGFLDTGLPAGPLVPVDVYRSMSYGLPTSTSDGFIVRPFRLATFEMTGLQLLTALEVALAGPPDIFPQVSGMRFDYDSSKPPGQRVLADSVHVGGRRIAFDARYTVTANEGLLMFLPALGIAFENPRVLDESASHAVQTLISRRLVIDAATSGRIRDRARP